MANSEKIALAKYNEFVSDMDYYREREMTLTYRSLLEVLKNMYATGTFSLAHLDREFEYFKDLSVVMKGLHNKAIGAGAVHTAIVLNNEEIK